MRIPVSELAEKYKDSIFRAAFSICRNPEDAEDVVQESFLQYMETSRQFESEEHIKAWLLTVAVNKAKDISKAFWHRNRTSLEDYMAGLPFPELEDRTLVESVLALPAPYRIVIYLYYYEDYSVGEISEIVHAPVNTVKTRLSRGRAKLKEILKDDWEDESDDE